MIPAIIILCVGVLLSAFYSGLETGLYTINRIRVDLRAAAGSRSARRILRMLDQPTRMLAVLLVANNVANYLASYGAASLLDSLDLGPWQAIIVNSLVLVPVLFVFGEVLPKDLYRAHTDRWTYATSLPLDWSGRMLQATGLVAVVSSVGSITQRIMGSDELHNATPRQRFGILFKEGIGSGAISAEQTSLADRALSMQSLTVRSEMVPWQRVNRLAETLPPQQRLAVIGEVPHTRLPVVDTSGRVTGILPVLDALLKPEAQTSELVKDTLHFSPDMPVREALHKLRTSSTAMAIVVDSGGPPLGIVTLKDLVEPLVGELAAW